MTFHFKYVPMCTYLERSVSWMREYGFNVWKCQIPSKTFHNAFRKITGFHPVMEFNKEGLIKLHNMGVKTVSITSDESFRQSWFVNGISGNDISLSFPEIRVRRWFVTRNEHSFYTYIIMEFTKALYIQYLPFLLLSTIYNKITVVNGN